MRLPSRNTRQFEVSLKEKVCRGCRKTFTPRTSLGGKFCSPKCHFAANADKPRKQIAQTVRVIKDAKCVVCRSVFTPVYNGLVKQKTCSSLCHRKLAKPPTPRPASFKATSATCKVCNKTYVRRSALMRAKKCTECAKQQTHKRLAAQPRKKTTASVVTRAHIGACVKYKKEYLKEHSYLSCEVCCVNQAFKFEVHHLYYASKHPNHPNLHNFRNLILICDDCHRGFHGQKLKSVFRKLETERGLKELFRTK